MPRINVISALLLFACVSSLLAVTAINVWGSDRPAIKGYDPVAYFTVQEPRKGESSYEIVHEGTRWRFASAANRDLFIANPNKYLPQYGGFCAWAVSQGYTAGIDPRAWKIVDTKLYLNYNQSVQQRWERDIPGHIASADRNWPDLQ